MLEQVGGKEAFDEGRKDLEVLAGVVVTTKTVERVSEAVGEQIEPQNQMERQRIMSGKVVPFLGKVRIPKMNVAIDGSGVPVVARETEGRKGKDETGKAKTREGIVCRIGGVVEAGCKTIFGQRLKLSGMHWTVRGADAIIALRCCQLSARWEEFWESRALG